MSIRRSDYESYDYREFWEDDKRRYEDRSERMALRTMLGGEESRDRLFVDIGCGYGRLFNEYSGFPRIVLIDYSMNNLKNARMRISKFLSETGGKTPAVLYIAADAARLPFRSDIADVILTVRVVHHLERPGEYFDEVSRILKKGGLYLFEFANKRNMKNILRFFIGKMDVSPFNEIPSQVGETIKNYHPKNIYSQLSSRDINIEKIISASNFRLGFLKKIFGSRIMVFFERIYQKLFPFITLGPSIFIKGRNARTQKKGPAGTAAAESRLSERGSSGSRISQFKDILICPGCREDGLKLDEKKIECRACGRSFAVDRGIIDFKI
ncbi:MAG: class I SAM-dependent methyltransferase [Actinomycetia bacterium]|nr:class I SAM-dependent methyltransferase [Actinomycetes bacterium]